MRILIIEDYSPLRRAVTEHLEDSGYTTDSTGCGKEGVWYAENHAYDLILLDIMLPHVDGLTILRHLRKLGRTTPIIITSARDSIENRVEGLDAGADDYLIKPFDLDELLARVRTQIRKLYKNATSTIYVGNLAIDLASKRVKVGDTSIDLTPREFNLLEYLAHRAGEVVSRSEIWEHVYHDYEGGSSNVVDVYIGYLRKKLKPAQADNYLKTRRGQGYTLEDQCV